MLPADTAADVLSATPMDADLVQAADPVDPADAGNPVDGDAFATTLQPSDPVEPSVFEDVMKRLEMRDGFELRYDEENGASSRIETMGGSIDPDAETKAMSEIKTAETEPAGPTVHEQVRNYTKAVNHSIELHLIANAGSSMTQAMNKLMQSH